MVDAIIIGGGASGLICGIEAGRRGKQCVILEQKEKAGKKLYATGNGRCNYANEVLTDACYRTVIPEDRGLVSQVITEDTWRELKDYFQMLGLPSISRQGYLYPRSEQAAAVVHGLEQAYLANGGRLQCGEHVTRIRWNAKKNCAQVWTEEQRLEGRTVVLATGGQASPVLGSDGSGYKLAKELGHRVSVCVPALCGLKCEEKGWGKLQGVRAKGRVALQLDHRKILEDTGEIQFTTYGLSGIVVFNLSHYAALGLQKKRRVEVVCDLLAEYGEADLIRQWKTLKKTCGYRSASDVLTGYLPEKLAGYLLGRAGIGGKKNWEELSEDALRRLMDSCKRLTVPITGQNAYEQAQVTAGGVPIHEVDLESMESRIQPGCYLTGELLDVDGACGGYNLMWAWETGRRAGKHL